MEQPAALLFRPSAGLVFTDLSQQGSAAEQAVVVQNSSLEAAVDVECTVTSNRSWYTVRPQGKITLPANASREFHVRVQIDRALASRVRDHLLFRSDFFSQKLPVFLEPRASSISSGNKGARTEETGAYMDCSRMEEVSFGRPEDDAYPSGPAQVMLPAGSPAESSVSADAPSTTGPTRRSPSIPKQGTASSTRKHRPGSRSPRFQQEMFDALSQRVRILEQSHRRLQTQKIQAESGKTRLEGEVLDLKAELETMRSWKGYAVEVDAKLSEMNADWQDFVKLRQNTDLKQMEIQNEKVLKILQMKDAKLEELVAEREKETNKARGSEQQLQERLHAAEARQREMLQDLQELETVRGQETKLQQQRVESLQAEAAELREERDRFAALCREVESRSTDELRSVRDALATAERRLCEGDAECERLKDLNAKAAEEIQKLLRECQEKQDELADRGTQRQGAATRRGRSHSPGDHLKEDGRVSSSRAAAAAVRGEIGSTIVSSSSAANNSNLESSSVFCLSQQQEASPQGNAGLVVENSQLAAEVERLQEVLAERDAELEDCERLLHHTRRKDLRTSDMRGGGNKDARICSPDVDASSTNAGAALETVKLMAQLKARLHESETKARKAESDAAELASKLQNTAEAEGEKRVKAEDALKVYTSKTYATGETQTSDAWWNEVQMLSDSAVSAVSAELRSELLKQEQVLHDQRLSAQREERISDDKLRDAQKELEFATKEAADWKKECENGQRTAAADVKEARDRACGLAEKMESLQQEIEVLQEQAGQSRKRHESEKAKLEAEVKTLDSRLNERHAQLVEALGSLEAATKVVNNHSKQGAPAGGPTASGSSSDGGAHAVGVNGQDHDAATSSQVGELLRRVSELTAKNLALTKARAGEQREKRFLEASFELLSREHETVTRRENTLASQLAVARKSLETVEKNCLNKTKAAEDASAALKQSEQERRRLWRDKAHAEEQSEHWRAELARERSEREELCARQVSRLRDERQRLEADVVQASTFGALEALFEQEFDADLHGGSSSSSASSDNKPKDHHHPPASSSSSAAAPGVSTSSNSSGSPRIPSSPVTFSAGLSQTVEDRKRAVKRPPPAPRGPPPSQNAARSRSASRQEQKTTPQVSFLVENETYISSDKHAVTAQSQGAHAHAGQHVQGHSHRGTSSSTQTQTHQHSRNASPSSSSRAPPNKHGNSALFTLLQSTLADLKQVLARRDDSVVDRVGNLYLSLVKKYFISEKQLAFAELRETRSRNQIARYAETAAGGEAKSLKMSGEVKNTSTSSKDSKDSTSSAKSSNQEENSGTTTVEFRTSRPETSSYLAAISELERSLEDTAATTEALRQHSFLLEAQNAELETKLRTQAEVSDRLSTQLALERSGQAANLESARHGMEEEVLAKIGGWKDALLDKVVSLALVGGGGGDSGGNKSASSLLGMNKEKTENLTSTTGKINITGLDSHNDAPLRTAQSTKDTTTGQSATTESSRTSPSDQEQVFEQMEHDLHRPRATARTGFEAAAHAAKVQRHCWSLEIAVQELSEELAKQKLLASSVWQQNTQLKAFIQPSSSGSGPVGGMLGTSGISAATNGGSRSMLDHSGTMLPGVGVAGGVVGSDTVVKNLVGGSAIDPASFDNSALSQVDQLLRSSRKPIYGTTGALQLVPFSYSSTMISAEGSATRLLSQVERRQKEFLATVYQNNEALRVRAQEQLQDKIKHLEQQLQQITLEREKIELERSRLSGAAMESREQTQRQILDLHEEKMREQSAAEAERRRLATTLSQTEIQLEDARRVTREQEDLLSSAMTREKQLREEVLALDGDRAQLQAVLTTERDAAEQGAAELAKVRLELRTATLEAERATNERLQIADAKESTEAELSEQLRAVQARASAAEESLHLRINDLDRLQMQTEKTRLELNSYEQKYTDALEMIDSLQADVGEKHQTDGENEQLRAQVARLELDAGSRELEIQGLVEAFEEVKKQQQPRNSLEGAALGQPSKEELQEETVMRTRVGTADTALAVTISDVVEQQHEIDPFDIGSMLDLQPPQQQPKPTSERLLTARGTDLRSSISLPRFGTNQQDQGCQTLLECPTGLRRAEERCYLVSASDHEALEAKMTKLRDKVASLEKRRALERQRVEEAAAREQQELISRLEALLDAQKHLQEKYITVKTAKKTLEARVMDLEQQNFSLLSQEEAEDRKASTNATRHDQLQHLADSPGDSAIVGVERAKAEMVVAVQGAGSTTLTANESTSGEADSSCSSSSSSPALGEPMSGTSNASAKKVVSSIETQTESGDASRSVDTSTKASQSEARPLSLCLRPAGDLSTVIDVYPDTMFQAKKAALAELLDGTQAMNAKNEETSEVLDLRVGSWNAKNEETSEVLDASATPCKNEPDLPAVGQGSGSSGAVPQSKNSTEMNEASSIPPSENQPSKMLASPSLAEVNGLLYDVRAERAKCSENSTLRLELEALRCDHGYQVDARKRLEHERSVLLRELGAVQEERNKIMGLWTGSSTSGVAVTTGGEQASSPTGGAGGALKILQQASFSGVGDAATMKLGLPSTASNVHQATNDDAHEGLDPATSIDDVSRLRKHNSELKSLLASSQNRFEELRLICESTEELSAQLRAAGGRESVLREQLELALSEQQLLREELRAKQEALMRLRYGVAANLEHVEDEGESQLLGGVDDSSYGPPFDVHVVGARQHDEIFTTEQEEDSRDWSRLDDASFLNASARGRDLVDRGGLPRRSRSADRTRRGRRNDVEEQRRRPASARPARGSGKANKGLGRGGTTRSGGSVAVRNPRQLGANGTTKPSTTRRSLSPPITAKERREAESRKLMAEKALRKHAADARSRMKEYKDKAATLETERDRLQEKVKDLQACLKLSKTELDCKKQLLLSLQNRANNNAILAASSPQVTTGSSVGVNGTMTTTPRGTTGVLEDTQKNNDQHAVRVPAAGDTTRAGSTHQQVVVLTSKEKEELVEKVKQLEDRSRARERELGRKEELAKGWKEKEKTAREKLEALSKKAKKDEETVKKQRGELERKETLLKAKVAALTDATVALQVTEADKSKIQAERDKLALALAAAKKRRRLGMQCGVGVWDVVPSTSSSSGVDNSRAPVLQQRPTGGSTSDLHLGRGTINIQQELEKEKKSESILGALLQEIQGLKRRGDGVVGNDANGAGPAAAPDQSPRGDVDMDTEHQQASSSTSSGTCRKSSIDTDTDSRSTKKNNKGKPATTSRCETVQDRKRRAARLFAQYDETEDEDEEEMRLSSSAATSMKGIKAVGFASSGQHQQGRAVVERSLSPINVRHSSTLASAARDSQSVKKGPGEIKFRSAASGTSFLGSSLLRPGLRSALDASTSREEEDASPPGPGGQNQNDASPQGDDLKLLTQSEELFGRDFKLRDKLSDKFKVDAAVLDSLSILNLTLEDVPAFLRAGSSLEYSLDDE